MDFGSTPGDDVRTGTTGDDVFRLWKGGNDTAHGDDGHDVFRLGTALTAEDVIDGGGGFDSMTIRHGYVGFTFGTTTLVDLERIICRGGANYDLTVVDENTAAGERLWIQGRGLGFADTLTFDGSAEKDGRFKIMGGSGDDDLRGGANDDRFQGRDGFDTFNLTDGGRDRANGGDSLDTFNLGGAFTARDQINGGDSLDFVNFAGDYGAVVFKANTITNVEQLIFADGFDYDFELHDNTTGSGLTLVVIGTAISDGHSLRLDASGETDGDVAIQGGAGDDVMIGGVNGDHFTGYLGADMITAGAGADLFSYDAVIESNGSRWDTITDFNALDDSFSFGTSVSDVDAQVTGSLHAATLNADLNSAIGSSMGVNHVITVGGTDGDLIGHVFLVFDLDGNGAYSADLDYVIDISGVINLGSLSTANFVS